MGIPVSKGETLTANGETIKIKNINAKDQNDNFSSEENRKPLKKHKKRKQIKHKSTNENSDNIESNNEYELLFNMANESRYKHDSQKSIELFKELRTKFPGRSYSKQALFLMGRIEQEQNKNNAQAKKWFEQYLRESQNGRLKEQAIGRLIELCKNMNNSCKIEYAKQYLNNYKNGTFANLAESVLH
jgi:TolA-binding protein